VSDEFDPALPRSYCAARQLFVTRLIPVSLTIFLIMPRRHGTERGTAGSSVGQMRDPRIWPGGTALGTVSARQLFAALDSSQHLLFHASVLLFTHLS
jgi:hypothetical protein